MQVQNRQDPPRNEPEFLLTMKILSTYTLIRQRSLCRHSHVHFIEDGRNTPNTFFIQRVLQGHQGVDEDIH